MKDVALHTEKALDGLLLGPGLIPDKIAELPIDSKCCKEQKHEQHDIDFSFFTQIHMKRNEQEKE